MFHVPINNSVLEGIQTEASNLSCELNKMNAKITKKLSDMSQGTLVSYQIYAEALSLECAELESCSDSVLELIMHADELAKDLTQITQLHAKICELNESLDRVIRNK